MKDIKVTKVAAERLLRGLCGRSCRGLGKGGLHVAEMEIPKGRIYLTRIVGPSRDYVCRGLNLRVKIRRKRSRAKRTVKVVHFAP